MTHPPRTAAAERLRAYVTERRRRVYAGESPQPLRDIKAENQRTILVAAWLRLGYKVDASEVFDDDEWEP